MRLRVLLLLPVFFILVTSCSNSVEEVAVPKVRAAFRNTGSETVQARVFIEGADGNAVTGAVVTVKDGDNPPVQLDYNQASLSYTGILEEPNSDTVYTAEVSTILSGNIISLKAPYTKVKTAPNVTVFQDSQGNSVLL